MARSPSWQFQLTTQVQFGRGRFRELGKQAAALGTRALLVGYAQAGGLASSYERAGQLLRKAGLDVVEFLQVDPDPDADAVAEGAAIARTEDVDVVVAIGGGSVIDAAKGVGVLAQLGGTAWDYVTTNPDCRPVPRKLPLLAVPTTAGTGAEVSDVAVISFRNPPDDGAIALKDSIAGPALAPEVALIDPELTLACPPALTAACAVDALGHAIESCLARRTNPISTMLGGRAVALIVEHLPKVLNDPADSKSRESLSLAATMAGAAFSQAGVIVSHAVAQSLGGVLHVPHGLAVAIATPPALRYNAEACVRQYAELARWCGLATGSEATSAANFLDHVVGLLQTAGLPTQIDVAPDAPRDLLDVLVANARAANPAPITLNPRKVDEASLRQMFDEVLRFPEP